MITGWFLRRIARFLEPALNDMLDEEDGEVYYWVVI